MSSDRLLERPVVPVASPDDAEATYNALVSHSDPTDCRPLVIHVIPDTEGYDSAEIDNRKQRAHEAFERFESRAVDDGMMVETEICRGETIAETIIEVARDQEASAIVFCSRGGSAWFDLLAGGVRTSLLAKSYTPVVMLPNDSE